MLKKWAGYFSDPVTLSFFVVAISFIIYFIKPKIGKRLLLACGGAFYLLSMPITSYLLMAPIEGRSNENPYTLSATLPDAIVVMGCGHSANPKIPKSSQYQECTLRRVVHAVMLHNELGVPVVFTGGRMGGKYLTEGENNQLLAISLGLRKEVTMSLGDSHDTAQESVDISDEFRDKRIILVTSASHVYRAKGYIEEKGVYVYTSPTDHLNKWYSISYDNFFGYVPNWRSLQRSQRALYEYMAWFSKYAYGR